MLLDIDMHKIYDVGLGQIPVEQFYELHESLHEVEKQLELFNEELRKSVLSEKGYSINPIKSIVKIA